MPLKFEFHTTQSVELIADVTALYLVQNSIVLKYCIVSRRYEKEEDFRVNFSVKLFDVKLGRGGKGRISLVVSPSNYDVPDR